MTWFWWLFSKKHAELKIVLATLSVLISLPLISVVVFAASGMSLISEVLASVNPVTKLVEIFDPNGNKVAELPLTTAWPARGYVSDEYGSFTKFRQDLGLGPHTGTDIANSFGLTGDFVTVFSEGKVIKTDDVDDSSCGKNVRVDHGNHIQSLYCHLGAVTTTEQADVKPGDIIGLMGSSGTSTGSHLHLQIEVYGIPVNARTFLTGEPEPSKR